MLNKNDEFISKIDGYAADGSGVARFNGFPVFIPAAIIGETIRVKVLKVLKNYAFGKALEVLSPSPERVTPICPVASRCGGCSLMHMSYKEQLNFKRIKVCDAMRKVGGFSDIIVHDTTPSPDMLGYRNKVSVPVATKDNEIVWGFYAVHSHNVVSCDKCFLHDEINNKIIETVISFMNKYSINAYNEVKHNGIIRHIYIRKMRTSGEIMVSIVSTKESVDNEDILVNELRMLSDDIKSIIINVNPSRTNIILGRKNRVLYGDECIYDTLLDTKFKINHSSFYQINSGTTELLYSKAISLLGDISDKTILDLYCGIGTISLIAAKKAKKVYGIEYVKEAIDDAIINAKLNGVVNAEFFAGDALKEIVKFKEKRIKPDYVIVDPPRKGCDKKVLETLAYLSPQKIVYVSCDCATLARDMKIMKELGYTSTEVYPFDMFPQTSHVECCVLLCQD